MREDEMIVASSDGHDEMDVKHIRRIRKLEAENAALRRWAKAWKSSARLHLAEAEYTGKEYTCMAEACNNEKLRAEKAEAKIARHENTIRNLNYEITELGDTIAALQEKLHRIEVWADAYPLSVFPEPDFKHVRELLESGGITLDSVSASNMRHVLQGIKSILAE